MIMMKRFAKIAWIALVALACAQNENFPDEPYVELEVYEPRLEELAGGITTEILFIRFYFTDGDGNIGLDDADTINPPHCTNCDHYYNLFVNVYSKVDGAFEFTYDYNSRIKNLTPNAQYQSLEGHMEYKIDITNRLSDTIMVDFYLEDRDLNASNLEMTPEVFVDL
jgi:hypothetical protein